MLHFKDVCQYGFVHKQCRCPDPSKTEHAIECDNPSSHAAIKDKPEMVNHPQHYNNSKSGVECIEVVRWMNFNVGSAVKYLWRLGHKNDALEEMKKAHWYLTDQLEMSEPSPDIRDFGEWQKKFIAHINTIESLHVSQALKFILNYHSPDSSYARNDALRLAIFEVASAISKLQYSDPEFHIKEANRRYQEETVPFVERKQQNSNLTV